MKFSAKEDLEIEIETLFDALCDTEAFERAAMRRGVDVVKLTEFTSLRVGSKWRVTGSMRGKTRQVEIELQRFETPNLLEFSLNSPNLKGAFEIELLAMSRSRTRLRMALDVRPKTLAARLILQSAKLARNTLNRRYKTRIKNFSRDLEDHLRRQSRA